MRSAWVVGAGLISTCGGLPEWVSMILEWVNLELEICLGEGQKKKKNMVILHLLRKIVLIIFMIIAHFIVAIEFRRIQYKYNHYIIILVGY